MRTEFKNDFSVVKNDFSVVKNDFSVVKNDFSVVKNDFSIDRSFMVWYIFIKSSKNNHLGG